MALAAMTVTIFSKSDDPFNVLPAQPLEIRDRNANGTSGNLAPIFTDLAGGTPISQPGAITNSLGQLSFFIALGPYNAAYTLGVTPVEVAFDVSSTDALFVHSTNVTTDINTTGAEVVDELQTSSEGHVVGLSKRTMTLEDLGYTGDADANKYVHSLNATTNVNTANAVVIDQISTDSEGHITVLSTRTMTAANLGAVPTSRTVNGKALSVNITLNRTDVVCLGYATGGVLTSGTAAPTGGSDGDVYIQFT